MATIARQGPEGEGPDAEGHSLVHTRHHGASDAPQKIDAPPALARRWKHAPVDGQAGLSSVRDDRLSHLERRSRSRDVVQLWSVDAMGVTLFKVCGTSRNGSESGLESKWKGAGMIW